MNQRFMKFLGSIAAIEHAVEKIKKSEMKDYGLRASDVMVLLELAGNKNGITAADISRVCEIDKGALSRILKILEEKGYVVPEQGDGRKYAAKLYLTEEGRKITDDMSRRIDRMVEEASADISHQERIRFYEILHEISDRIMKICEQEEI